MAKAIWKASALVLMGLVGATGGIAFGAPQVAGSGVVGNASAVTADALAGRVVLAAENAARDAANSVDQAAIERAVAADPSSQGLSAEALALKVADAVQAAVADAVRVAVQRAIATTISTAGVTATTANAALALVSERLSNSQTLASLAPSVQAAVRTGVTQAVTAVATAVTAVNNAPAAGTVFVGGDGAPDTPTVIVYRN